MEEVVLRDLGTAGYEPCLALQRRLHSGLLEAKRNGGHAAHTLLLCEHPPVYTLGRSARESNVLFEEEFLRRRGAEIHRIERGGDVTFHGPGQLVAYPVLDLERLGMGLKDYVNALEQTALDTAAAYGVAGCRVPGASGVWVTGPKAGGGKADEAPRKLCAVGVYASRWVTMHGSALNVSTDLRWFSHINPCGFADRGVTSLEAETGRAVPMAEVKRLWAAAFERNINVKIKY